MSISPPPPTALSWGMATLTACVRRRSSASCESGAMLVARGSEFLGDVREPMSAAVSVELKNI